MKLKNDYIELHKNKNYFNGYSLVPSKDHVYNVVKKTNSKTILDYGSGKGQQYSNLKLDLYWGVEVDCYDPGYEPFFELPNKLYDGVICTEVMEHVPEDEVDQVMTEIFERATKFVYFSIALSLAGKKLLDGSNVHVTIKPMKWWNEKINQHNKNGIKVVCLFSGIDKRTGQPVHEPMHM